MTFMVLTAAAVTIGSTDISDHCSKAELSIDVEEKDVTTFGSAGWKEVKGGLKSGQLDLSLKNDLDDNDLDEMLWNLNGTTVAFTVKAVNETTTASNPKYSGTVLVKGLKPIAGSVGDVNEQDVSFPTSGAVSRTTA